MAKRATLRLEDLTAKKGTEPAVEPLPAEPTQAAEPAAVRPARRPRKPRAKPAPAGDEERRGQTLRLTVSAWRQLKFLAAEEGRPAHDLLVEAVNMLFRKKGKPPIA
jgi:hypothetical protein